jgi:hypothetical protein
MALGLLAGRGLLGSQPLFQLRGRLVQIHLQRAFSADVPLVYPSARYPATRLAMASGDS